MDYEALWTEIQANPACEQHIVPSLPKADEAARAGDAAIATILSEVRRSASVSRTDVLKIPQR